MERSDPPALRTGNDKLRTSFKHVQRSLSGHRQAHRCEKRVKESHVAKELKRHIGMDQPQDHKKGHVNLNVHATTQGDRHPSVVSIYPHRLLAFSQNVRPGEGSVPTGPTTGKLQSLMTSRAEKGTQDLMR